MGGGGVTWKFLQRSESRCLVPYTCSSQLKSAWPWDCVHLCLVFSIPPRTENYLCSDVNGDIWLTAKLLYACKPPPFYTVDFKESCDAEVFHKFGIRKPNITLDNATAIYCHLISC